MRRVSSVCLACSRGLPGSRSMQAHTDAPALTCPMAVDVEVGAFARSKHLQVRQTRHQGIIKFWQLQQQACLEGCARQTRVHASWR